MAATAELLRAVRQTPLAGLALLALTTFAAGQSIVVENATDAWVTVIGSADGTGARARDEALAAAQRKAVEQKCGVFLKSASKTRNYQAVYDKIFADAVGYVREYETLKVWTNDDLTFARIRARVSNQKFEKDWASIAHTLEREGNPRLIVAIAEAKRTGPNGWIYEIDADGTGQAKIENFLLNKGLQLMDRGTAEKVSKRDVLLATIKDDAKAVAAIGARFKADVVVTGKATVEYSQTLDVAGQSMHQFKARLIVRAIQTDSARLLASKSYDVTSMTLHRGGGLDKALAKLGDESAPKLLAAVVEAWRKRAHVKRTISLLIEGMDFATFLRFKKEAAKLRGVQAVNRREITEEHASIDVEYEFDLDNLAEKLMELKTVGLEVREITANRIRLKVVPNKTDDGANAQ